MNSPKKLKKGSHIRIIAPSRSMGLLSDKSKQDAIKKLEDFGFSLSFGKHVNEIDEFNSSSVNSRVEDIHEAFSDITVDGILTVIGGYNSNQLLSHLDYDLIAKNPKVFCGFSDITAVANAITAKSNFITYTGPHFSSWAIKYGFEYSIEYFIKCCMSDEPYELFASEVWSDDPWFIDQEKRDFINNEGYWVMNAGTAKGQTVGSHGRCLSALQGTQYWPGFKDSILLIEEDAETNPALFDRILQSFIQLPDFSGVKGLLIGRFQKDSKMTRELLAKIIETKPELKSIPVVANVNLGHTLPLSTLPIGGEIEITATSENAKILVVKH
jgi:muramoyltetrapeptide carboxypeptidase LdcA involved in peptidoglycan recycling